MIALHSMLYGVFLSLALAVALCAQKTQSDCFPDEAGKAMPVETATVVSQREVTIRGSRDNDGTWGALVGATTAGSIAYGIKEAHHPAAISVTMVAAIAGDLAGTVAEEYRNSSDGVEYVLRGEDGKNFALVQSTASSHEIVSAGTEVVIIRGSGGFLRVVPSSN